MAQDVVKIESFTFSIPIGTSNTWKGDINVPSGHKRLKAVLLLPGNYDSTGTKIGLNDKDGSKILGDIPILALKDNIVFNPNSPNTSFVNLDRPIDTKYSLSYILGSTTTSTTNTFNVLLLVE